MKLPLRWLTWWVTIERSPRELVELLAMAGIEVERLHGQADFSDAFVVAQVLAVRPHPGADKLSLVQVDDGQGGRQIVCGARNMTVGDRVVLALPGAVLPDGRVIERATVRGEPSAGMLCSSAELGLTLDHAGLLILSEEAAPGALLRDVHPGEGLVLELSLTPNRSDCLSALGLSREIAALTGAPLRAFAPAVAQDAGLPAAAQLAAVTVAEPQLCPTYAARVLEGVRVGPSPAWLAERLTACGIRSINNVVDATNFVMMELGQPLHAFDLDTLQGARVEVRLAREGEKLLCLDGVERALRPSDLVIADANAPVALAGVMGGEPTGVSAATTRLLLESACFEPLTVRRAARAHGLRSESSHRFERGVDPAGQLRAVDRLAEIILQVAGGQLAPGRIVVGRESPDPVELPVRCEWIRSYLGLALPDEVILAQLRALGFECLADGGGWRARTPSWRVDVGQEADLAEEVARRYGYAHLPGTTPLAPITTPRKPALWREKRRVEDHLAAVGLHQAVTYAFVPGHWLDRLGLDASDPRRNVTRLRNPLSEEMAVLRPVVLPSLLHAASRNTHRQNRDVALFEVGTVFERPAGQLRPDERPSLALVMVGRRWARSWDRPGDEDVDVFDLRGVVESLEGALGRAPLELKAGASEPWLIPGRAWTVMRGSRVLGTLGELHPRVARAFELEGPVVVAELDLRGLATGPAARDELRPLPAHPRVARDLAVVVDRAVPAGEVLAAILEMSEPLLEDVSLFDVYQGPQVGEGKKNLAFSLTYRAPDRTLTEAEVSPVHQHILSRLGQRFAAALRA